MEKKNPYKFTLGFDKTKPSHVRATEILNSVKDKTFRVCRNCEAISTGT